MAPCVDFKHIQVEPLMPSRQTPCCTSRHHVAQVERHHAMCACTDQCRSLILGWHFRPAVTQLQYIDGMRSGSPASLNSHLAHHRWTADAGFLLIIGISIQCNSPHANQRAIHGNSRQASHTATHKQVAQEFTASRRTHETHTRHTHDNRAVGLYPAPPPLRELHILARQ